MRAYSSNTAFIKPIAVANREPSGDVYIDSNVGFIRDLPRLVSV